MGIIPSEQVDKEAMETVAFKQDPKAVRAYAKAVCEEHADLFARLADA